jgi:hypothetical protein
MTAGRLDDRIAPISLPAVVAAIVLCTGARRPTDQ